MVKLGFCGTHLKAQFAYCGSVFIALALAPKLPRFGEQPGPHWTVNPEGHGFDGCMRLQERGFVLITVKLGGHVVVTGVVTTGAVVIPLSIICVAPGLTLSAAIALPAITRQKDTTNISNIDFFMFPPVLVIIRIYPRCFPSAKPINFTSFHLNMKTGRVMPLKSDLIRVFRIARHCETTGFHHRYRYFLSVNADKVKKDFRPVIVESGTQLFYFRTKK